MIKKPYKTKMLYGAISIFFTIYSLTVLFPFVWAFLCAIKSKEEYLADSLSFPKSFSLVNFAKAFKQFKVYDSTFTDMFFTSLSFTFFGTLMSVASSYITAYVIAKYKFALQKFLYGMAIFIMVIPIVGSMPAMYRLVTDLNMKDNPVAISLLYGGGFGMNFIILHGFVSGISWSYAEAVFLDGGSDFTAFVKVMLPQAKMAITTLVVVTFITAWNNYEASLLYFPNYPTLASGLYRLKLTSTRSGDFPAYYAGLMVSTIPLLIVYASCSNIIFKNMSIGGLKG